MMQVIHATCEVKQKCVICKVSASICIKNCLLAELRQNPLWELRAPQTPLPGVRGRGRERTGKG